MAHVSLVKSEENDYDSLKLSKKIKQRGRGFNDKSERMSIKDESMETFSIDSAEFDGLGPQRSIEGWILFITNLHEEAQDEDLHDKCSEFGKIKNIHMNLDRRTGFLKGYALVEYESYKEAACALEALDNTILLGQEISVDWCFVKGPKNSKSLKKKPRK